MDQHGYDLRRDELAQRRWEAEYKAKGDIEAQGFRGLSLINGGIDDNYANSLGHQVRSILEHVRITLRGLRETAGLPEDKAIAAMAPWTPQ